MNFILDNQDITFFSALSLVPKSNTKRGFLSNAFFRVSPIFGDVSDGLASGFVALSSFFLSAY
jgi:hypothetical protein